MRTLIVLAALVLTSPAHAQTLASLAWMQGCWSSRERGVNTNEVWVAPPGAALFGFAITDDADTGLTWEQMRIDSNGEGRIFFVAMPGGGDPVRFALRESDEANLAVFENAKHDFPQRIVYRRDGQDLVASISALDGARQVNFHYRLDAECRPTITP
jgi:hypothetical protein